MTARVRCVVSGLVQGVGYRYHMLTKGRALGVRGWVRNLNNGDVEFVAEGPKDLLEQLISIARIGPRAAMVKDVKLEWGAATGEFSGFDVQ